MKKQFPMRSVLEMPALWIVAWIVIGLQGPGVLASEMPPDPATSTEYPCALVEEHEWTDPQVWGSPVVGDVWYPSETCDPQDGTPYDRPILIFAHGKLMHLRSHQYLMRHLARNGFVVASITNGGSNEERARQMISFLNRLNEEWTWRHRLIRVVALAGHSRGGEAAVTAARLLDEEGLGAFFYLVRGVISIAPTDGGGDGSDPRETLTGDMTNSFLALYGSADEDVKGSQAIDPNTEPQRTAFALYDRAGSEFSNEGLSTTGFDHLDKAFVFLTDAGHRAFLDSGVTGSLGGGTSFGMAAAKGYFNSFLRWHLREQDEYRGFFDGRWRPGLPKNTIVSQQFSSGRRRVVDAFQNGIEDETTIGGDWLAGDGFATLLEGPLWQTVSSSPHETGGLRVTWYGTGSRFLVWGIPDEVLGGIGRVRNVSSYTHLSFRVGQAYRNVFNSEGVEQDFYVQIVSAGGFSNLVRVGSYDTIPYPDPFICYPNLISCPGGGDFSKSAMATVRLPLTAFSNVDWTDVYYMTFFFGLPGTPETGAIQLDSLEFQEGPVGGATVFADGFESGDLAGWEVY